MMKYNYVLISGIIFSAICFQQLSASQYDIHGVSVGNSKREPSQKTSVQDSLIHNNNVMHVPKHSHEDHKLRVCPWNKKDLSKKEEDLKERTSQRRRELDLVGVDGH